MILLEVFLERVVVEVIVWMSRVPSVADEASFVLHPTVLVQLIVVVEPFSAEAAERMALETGLVRGAGLVVAMTHVLLQLTVSKKLVLVREYPLVTSAEIAHALAVGGLDMTVQIRPA
jgi:hypothetical protein